MSNVEGYADRVRDSRVLCGWARVEGKSLTRVRVLVFDGEEVIGRGMADMPRGDFDSDCGFEIECSRTVLVDDLRVGRVWIVGFGEERPGILQAWQEIAEEKLTTVPVSEKLVEPAVTSPTGLQHAKAPVPAPLGKATTAERWQGAGSRYQR